MQVGFIKSWDAMKGYGFITSEDDQDLFFHSADLHLTLKPTEIRGGMRVKFDVRSDFKGDKAINIRRA